jgi:hypothetical protein
MDLLNQGKRDRIPLGVKPTTKRWFSQLQHIQSVSRYRSLTLTATEKSIWWGRVDNLSRKSLKRLPEKPRKRSLEPSDWPKRLTEERDTTVCKMTRIV